MDLEGLRRLRRILSAVVSLSAVALVMARTAGDTTPSAPRIGLAAAGALLVSLAALTVVWRKEHAAGEEAFAARERAQLAMLRLQAELAKKKAARQDEPGGGA
jgi:hypothetical protein